MTTGEKIKRIRQMRNMTQRELGLAIGYPENSSDVRIGQYEQGTRTPKEETLRKIAEVLNVGYYSLYEPPLYGNSYASRDLMLILFELEEHSVLKLVEGEVGKGKNKEKRIYIGLDDEDRLLNSALYEWSERRKQLDNGEITENEYQDWKLNYPNSSDERKDWESYYNWRK